MGPVVVAMANKVGRIELLTWLKAVVPRIPAGEVSCTASPRLWQSFVADVEFRPQPLSVSQLLADHSGTCAVVIGLLRALCDYLSSARSA